MKIWKNIYEVLGFKIVLNLTLTPKISPKHQKIAPKGPQKSAKEASNVAELKQKDGAVLRKAKLSFYKKVFEHISLFQKKQTLLPQNTHNTYFWSVLRIFKNFTGSTNQHTDGQT